MTRYRVPVQAITDGYVYITATDRQDALNGVADDLARGVPVDLFDAEPAQYRLEPGVLAADVEAVTE